MEQPPERRLEVDLAIHHKDAQSLGTYSADRKVAEMKVVVPFPVDVERTHEAIAESLALMMRNVDATYGVIPGRLNLEPGEVTVIDDVAAVTASADDPLPF